jgi:hypothetical protein
MKHYVIKRTVNQINEYLHTDEAGGLQFLPKKHDALLFEKSKADTVLETLEMRAIDGCFKAVVRGSRVRSAPIPQEPKKA